MASELGKEVDVIFIPDEGFGVDPSDELFKDMIIADAKKDMEVDDGTHE